MAPPRPQPPPRPPAPAPCPRASAFSLLLVIRPYSPQLQTQSGSLASIHECIVNQQHRILIANSPQCMHYAESCEHRGRLAVEPR